MASELTDNIVFPRDRKAIKISKKKEKAFLKALAITGKVITAARAAGYTTSIFLNEKRRKDKEFAAKWEVALEAAGDALEEEAIRRAKDGVMEPIMYKGKVVGWKYVYSDQLLIALLKAHKPDKFRESVNIHGTVKHDVGIAILPMTAPKPEDWEKAAIETHQGQKLLEDNNTETIDIVPEEEGVKLSRS